jgi:hypothetical protein
MDDQLHAPNSGMRQKDLEHPLHDGFAAQRPELLGNRPSGPRSAAGRDDDCSH